MDLILLIGIATALLIVILTLYFFSKQTEKAPPAAVAPQRGVPQRAQEGIPRRAQIARNQRNRLRTAANAQNAGEADEAEDDSDNEFARESAKINIDEKMGAKKRAKMEAKAEKKAQREAELHLREEKKKKETLLEEERKRKEEKLEEDERKREEAERIAREEKERKEYEEYLKIKEAFSIEEEGFEEDDNEKENLLAEFIQYIKDNKVVVLEDLGTHFKLKTQQVIERITDLQKDGLLTGVVDDRGKFIYISEDELQAVAKFIRQRGRVSITELAECSNNLINLSPVSA